MLALNLLFSCVTCGPGTYEKDGVCVPGTAPDTGSTSYDTSATDDTGQAPNPGNFSGETRLPGDAIVIQGKNTGDATGLRVEVADLNGDGQVDLALSAIGFDQGFDDNGLVAVFEGPITADMSVLDAPYQMLGTGKRRKAGFRMEAVGRTLVIGDEGDEDNTVNGKRAYDLWPVTTLGSGPLDQVTTHLVREQVDDLAGNRFASAGDVTGDGVADLLVGAPYSAAGQQGAGAAYIFSGVEGGDLYTQADVRILGQNGQYNLGLGGAVSGYGDINGDGVDDIGVGGAGWFVDGVGYVGRVDLFLGPVSGFFTVDDADHSFEGKASGGMSERHAMKPVGDLDGDGYDEVALYLYQATDGSGEHIGVLYILSGADIDSVSTVATAYWQIHPDSEYGQFSALGVGDIDGDDKDDLMLGAPSDEYTGKGSGSVYLNPGGQGGLGASSDYSAATWRADGENWALGEAVGAGDLTGDGVVDLVMSAYNSPGGGAVYIFSGAM